MQIKGAIFFSFLLFLSCTEPAPKLEKVKVSGVHYWNTSWVDSILLSPELQKYSNIYLHVFDVTKESGISEPVPSFVIDTIKANPNQKYIPIAYLTTEAFQYYIDEKRISQLASRISNLLSRISERNKHIFDKFILDFDWNLSNQYDYFNLLDTLKSSLASKNIELGATLRLHQLKLGEKMKAPQLEYMLLMCYNMSSPKLVSSQNSIFNRSDFEIYSQYIPNYPVDLEFIIPVYTQWVLFRKGKYKGLLREVHPEEFNNKNVFKHSGNIIEVKQDYSLGVFKLLEGDKIKTESVKPSDLESISQTFASLNLDTVQVSIFDALSLLKNTELQKSIAENF